MGFGNYSHEAHQAITQARTGLAREQVFKQTSCHPLMNPLGVRARESRDGPAHPNSLGIVFALDVTGSMGDIPDMLARRELPTFMNTVLALGIADPQVLFMAVGDATSDNAPLQVGQFESAAREMDQWLTWSFLEGGGGGSGEESYELALYFAARHTEMDCWVKRKKRGYLLMTGDENPYPRVSKQQASALIGDANADDIPIASIVRVVSETFQPFFLVPDLDRRSRHLHGERGGHVPRRGGNRRPRRARGLGSGCAREAHDDVGHAERSRRRGRARAHAVRGDARTRRDGGAARGSSGASVG